jgi:hypothetical protein
MASPTPVVLTGVDLLAFLQHIMNEHVGPSAIIVCSSKETFMRHLQDALISKPAPETDEDTTAEQSDSPSLMDVWTTPTLRLLAATHNIRLVFCPELSNLWAYLSTYTYRQAKDSTINQATGQHRILAILNPISIHRPATSFSAQGINRTISLAVDAAYHSQSHLVLAECPFENERTDPDEPTLHSESPEATTETSPLTPWDEEVSILNVTTKSFGVGGRGWVGRTVTIRRIAERWCHFCEMSLPTDDE